MEQPDPSELGVLTAGSFYRYFDEKRPVLLHVLGFMPNWNGETLMICDIFVFSLEEFKMVHSIQGPPKVKLSEWVLITKEEYERRENLSMIESLKEEALKEAEESEK